MDNAEMSANDLKRTVANRRPWRQLIAPDPSRWFATAGNAFEICASSDVCHATS